MSILPPPLHDQYFPANRPAWEYRRMDYTPPDYSPLSDGPLNIYLNICEFIVRHLGIDATGTVEDQSAAAALLNPAICRLAWPCRDDLETYEEYVLMPYLNAKITKESPLKALETVKKELNLTHAEAFDLVETAKTYAQQAYTFDPARERSVMLNKLHGLAEDCSEAGMVTTQLNSFKTIAQILRLTQAEEDTNMDKREVLSSALEAEFEESTAKILPGREDKKNMNE
jgi:hypothetical protein